MAAATRRALPARMLLLPTRASCRTVQELLPDPDTGLRSHRIQMRPEKASVRKGHGAQVAPLLLCDATALREQGITAQSRNSGQSRGRGGHSRTQPGGRSREHGLKVASRNLPSGQMVLPVTRRYPRRCHCLDDGIQSRCQERLRPQTVLQRQG